MKEKLALIADRIEKLKYFNILYINKDLYIYALGNQKTFGPFEEVQIELGFLAIGIYGNKAVYVDKYGELIPGTEDENESMDDKDIVAEQYILDYISIDENMIEVRPNLIKTEAVIYNYSGFYESILYGVGIETKKAWGNEYDIVDYTDSQGLWGVTEKKWIRTLNGYEIEVLNTKYQSIMIRLDDNVVMLVEHLKVGLEGKYEHVERVGENLWWVKEKNREGKVIRVDNDGEKTDELLKYEFTEIEIEGIYIQKMYGKYSVEIRGGELRITDISEIIILSDMEDTILCNIRGAWYTVTRGGYGCDTDIIVQGVENLQLLIEGDLYDCISISDKLYYGMPGNWTS